MSTAVATSKMEIRTRPVQGLELRETGSGPGRLAGYAVVFGALSSDLGGFREKVAPGAFTDSLHGDVRAFYNHDSSFVLGRTTSGTLRLRQDSRGLGFELDVPNTTAGRDLVELVRRGDITGVSFGFHTRRDSWDKSARPLPIRTLEAVDLVEISPVALPAYPQTSIAARALDVARRCRGRGCNLSLADRRTQLAAAERKLASIDGDDLPTRRRHLAAAERALAGCCVSDALPLGPVPQAHELRVLVERRYGPTLRRTATHESGHAVAALLEGAGIRWVAIGFRKVGIEWTPSGGRMSPRRTIRDPSTWLAGLAAERLARAEPRKLDSILRSTDFEVHERMARARGRAPSLAYPDDMRHAEMLLSRNWRAVRVLAARLLEVGVVDGDEAERIVLGALDANTRLRLRRAA